MNYVNAFLMVGIWCLIGQIILDNTKLTPGHVTSIFVVLGSLLSFFGIYHCLSLFSPVGSAIPIVSFGNSLYQSAWTGYLNEGILGIFKNLLITTSAGISAAVVFAFLAALFSKPKN